MIWYSIVIKQPCVLTMYVSIYLACEIACSSSLIYSVQYKGVVYAQCIETVHDYI
jgi:hypothetical protein